MYWGYRIFVIVTAISNMPAPTLISRNLIGMYWANTPVMILASPTTNRAVASMRTSVKISRPGYARTTADNRTHISPKTMLRARNQFGAFFSSFIDRTSELLYVWNRLKGWRYADRRYPIP